MTSWIQLPETLAQRARLTGIPLPVSDETAASVDRGTVDPAAIASDVSRYRTEAGAEDPADTQLDRAVAALALLAAFARLESDEYQPAVELLELGLAHEAETVALRSLLDPALWDDGHRFDALIHLLAAVRWSAERGEVAPALWIITSRILQEAGRYQDALALLEDLADTAPREPRFWDLIDAIEAHAKARHEGDPGVRTCTACGSRVPADAGFCTSCGAAQATTCSACGTALAADAAYCTRCGRLARPAPAPAEPAAVTGCARCGADLAAGDSFCTSCGTPVAGPTAPPQAATPTVIVAAPSTPAATPQPAPVPPATTYAATVPSGPTAQTPAPQAAPAAPGYAVPEYPGPAPTAPTGTVRSALLAAGVGLVAAAAGLFFGWIRVPGMSIGDGAAPLQGPTPFRIGDWLDTSIKVDGIAAIALIVAAAAVLILHVTGRLGGRVAAGTLSGLAALLLLVGLLQLQYIADLGNQFTGSRFQADLGLLLLIGGAVFTLTLSLLSWVFDKTA